VRGIGPDPDREGRGGGGGKLRRDPILSFEYRLAVALGKTVQELRGLLTTSELAHWMAMFNLYPMGEEAMDHRMAALLARLNSGVPVVQIKKGKMVQHKKHLLFDRDFWMKPMSPKALGKKLVGIFTKDLGMKKGDDG